MSDQRPTPHSPESSGAALKQAGAGPLRSTDPALIGPYVPLGLLGSGGMGRVYLARPTDDTPGLAAVKVIRPEYAEDPDFRRRFQREAAVHARVVTAHAPRLLGTGFEDELLWMATQYLPGLNLADAVRACGPLEPAGVWRLVAELGRALSALAAAGVVHRDLKPSNVILSLRSAHVIDFGISRAADSSAITTTGNRVGTPAYMSPEYLREGRCDTASDVFSLACAIVYAATGHAPFGDGTGVDVMHRVAFEEPKHEVMAELTAADPPLAALLSSCLAKDPAGRPTPKQLIDAATAAGHGHTSSWHEPLTARLLSRQQGCELLEHDSAEESGHFHPLTWQVAAPALDPASGPVTPPGQHGGPATPVQYDPATAHPSGEHGDGRKRTARLLALGAGIAVVAVAAGAFFLTRPGLDETASAAPTVSAASPSDSTAASAGPGTSGSPSATKAKETADEKEKVTDDQSENADSAPPGSTGEAPAPSADDPTATSGSDNGGGSAPTPTPTRTATKPATPPWISQCTYYSGTELTTSGDKGQRVVQVQCMLTKRGYSVGGAGVDGQFGEDTVSAVRLFQSDKGLVVDGDVGPKTWAALRSST